MVSVHNTQNYHNYIYNFNINEFSINKNTILDFIVKNHTDIYTTHIKNNNRLKSLLNNNNLKQTLFISINNSINNIYDCLFEGNIEVNDKDLMIINKNNYAFELSNNKLNGREIIISNIKLQNGILHIIN